MSLLKGEGLVLHFGGVRAVDGVDFEVRPGEILTFIGPNGAGKTTLFNLISRIYTPTQGRLRYREHDVTRIPPHRVVELGIARTYQNTELFERATVLSNLLAGRHRHRRSGVLSDLLFLPRVRETEWEHRRKVEEVIDFLGLQHYRDRVVDGLPFGVRKIVELGRALCTEPEILLLDEPSAGLNPEETEEMAFWIEDIRNDLGVTILLVEHNMGLVAWVSDRVVALNNGRIMAEGTVEEVQRNPEVIRAYLGE